MLVDLCVLGPQQHPTNSGHGRGFQLVDGVLPGNYKLWAHFVDLRCVIVVVEMIG